MRLPPTRRFPALGSQAAQPLNGVIGQQPLAAPRRRTTGTRGRATRTPQQTFQPAGGG